MAGSRAWYVYTDDDDQEFAVELDEDTGSSTDLGFTAYTPEADIDLLPKGMKMRYVNTVQTSGAGAGYRSRPFPCGTTAAPAFANKDATFTINNLSYVVTSTRGERKRRAKATPTGLSGNSSTVGGGSPSPSPSPTP